MKVYVKRNPAKGFGCSLSEGETGDVSDNVGKMLLKAGIADRLDDPNPPKQKPKPEPIKAVPNKPKISEVKESAIKTAAAKPKKPSADSKPERSQEEDISSGKIEEL